MISRHASQSLNNPLTCRKPSLNFSSFTTNKFINLHNQPCFQKCELLFQVRNREPQGDSFQILEYILLERKFVVLSNSLSRRSQGYEFSTEEQIALLMLLQISLLWWWWRIVALINEFRIVRSLSPNQLKCKQKQFGGQSRYLPFKR